MPPTSHAECHDDVAEAARHTRVAGQTDVVVCGGGPAGVAAALTAARWGASVLLIEVHGQLGGVWTSGLLCWILDSGNKSGVMAEIVRRLQAVDAARPPIRDGVGYSPEAMKILLEEMCAEAGVRVRYHTRCAGVVRDDRRITHVLTESKSGREAFAADVFIDATGDGDLAALAGCRFDVGREVGDSDGEPGEVQPVTLMAMVAGVDCHALHAAGLLRGPGVTPRQSKDRLRAILAAQGVEPSYGDPTLFPVGGGLMGLMTHHGYGSSATDADDLTEATIRGRAEIHRVVTALDAYGGPLAGLRVVATAAQIGVREARRIRGLYRVTAQDAIEGKRHRDAVCEVTFNFDVHSTRAAHGKGVEKRAVNARPYDIPYRALVAADVDNLLLAGRCISGDFLAHSGYRVTGNSVALGEAAGAAGAYAATQRVGVADIDYTTLRNPEQAAVVTA